MELMDWFKPDWQHSIPEKRQLAVATIEAPEIFAEMLAHEQVQSVKEAIFKKHATIESLQRLLPLVNGIDKTVLEKKLNQLQLKASLNANSIREAYVKELDAKQVKRVAREAKSIEVQLQALDCIEDMTALSAIIQDTHGQVAQSAVEKISDKDLLQKLMKVVNNKNTRLVVRKRYEVLFGEEEKAMERKIAGRARLEQILTVLNGMAKAADWSSLHEEFVCELHHWNQLSEFSTEAQNREFHELYEQCQRRKTEYEQWAAEKAAKAAEIEARVQARRLLLRELSDATEVFQEHSGQCLAEMQQRWEMLGAVDSPEELADQERFDRAIKTFVVNQERLRDLQEKKEAAHEDLGAMLTEIRALQETDVSSALRAAVEQQRHKLGSLDEYFKREFASLYETCQAGLTDLERKLAEWEAEAKQRAVTLHEEYEALIAAVDACAKTSQAHTRKIQKMQAAWKQLENLSVNEQDKLNKRFRQSCDRYFAKLKHGIEEKEWAEFANLALKEKLIAETEALDAVEDPVELAAKIKEKQTQWKEIGPVPYTKSNEMWTRFKTVSDTLYERCKRYYEEQDAKRQKSLEAKLAMCEQAEALQHSQDWKAVGEKLKELQGQWKEAGHGPRKKDQQAWKRFHAACETFFSARKAHYAEWDASRAENTLRKQALVVEMEKWAVAEKLSEAAQRIKDLQTEWKNLGPATRDQEQILWERFHQAADGFFERRREHYQHMQKSLEDNARVKETLCAQLKEKLEELNDDSDWTGLSQLFRQSQKDWRSLAGAGVKRDEALWKRFKGLCDNFFDARNKFYDTLSDEDRVRLHAKEEYCLKVELLVESAEWRETAEELKQLQAEFKDLPSVNEKYDRILYQRFHGVCQTFFDRRREHFKELDDKRLKNLTRKKALCARLEELAGVEYQGNEEVEQLSREDLARQLQKAMAPNLSEETVKPLSFKEASQEIRELQAAWKAIGPVPKAQAQAVWERFRQAADIFYEKRQAFFGECGHDAVQNLKVKEELIAKLEAQLKEPDIKTVQNLQKQWRECGDGLRDKGRELHQKFRTLCDQIYHAASEESEHTPGEIRM